MENIDLNNLDILEKDHNIRNAQYFFFGLEMQQIPTALLKINRLLNHINFQRIIELGTGKGGLSLLLSIWADLRKKEFYSFDVLNFLQYPYKINFFQGDILNEEKNIQKIKDLIAAPGRVMVLCDAHKSIEYNIYASSLKSGDFILTHDYSPNLNVFETEVKNKLWNHFENCYEKIEEETKKNNIKINDYMLDCVWSIGIKE